MKITMKDFIAAARQGGDIVLTEDRRVQGTGGTLSGRNVQRVPTNPTDPRTQQLRQQTLGKKLQKAFEHKYMYGRKIQDPNLKKRFLAIQIKASDIDQLVVDGKKIRRSAEFQLERCAAKEVKSWVQSHPQAFPGLFVDHHAVIFQALAYEAGSLDGNPTDPINVIEERVRKSVDGYLYRVSQYMSQLPKDASPEHRQMLLYILLHPSMADMHPGSRYGAMGLITNYFITVVMPRCSQGDLSIRFNEKSCHDEHVWKALFGLPAIIDRRSQDDHVWKAFFRQPSISGNDNLEKSQRPNFILELTREIVKDSSSFSTAVEKNNRDMVGLLIGWGLPINATGKDGMTPLHQALALGNLEMAKFLNDLGADKNAVDHYGRTSLHYACRSGNLEIVKLLVQLGGKIEANDQFAQRPLHFACKSGNLELVKFLVDRGARLNETSSYGSPLYLACESGNLEMVKFLVERGANVKATDNVSYMPLHAACRSGNLEMVKFLVERGADVKAPRLWGNTPLHSACESRNVNPELIQFLVEHGADVNAVNDQKNTVLHIACKSGNLEIVKYLVERGAKGESMAAACESGNLELVKYLVERGAKGWDLWDLYGACASGNLELVKYLVERGANVKEVDQNGGPLHYACYSGNLEMVKFLVERGADVKTVNWKKNTVLHSACRSSKCSLELIKFLVERGADVKAVNNDIDTPLHFASEYGHVEIAKYLIERGADVNAIGYRKETPLEKAIERGKPEMVKLLLDSGADLKAVDENGRTPLHKACSARNSNLEVIKILIDRGADINACNKNRSTPLSYAYSDNSGKIDVVKYLISRGAEFNPHDESLFKLACRSGDLEFVKFLIDRGAFLKIVVPNDYGYPPLFDACKSGNLEMVKLILEMYNGGGNQIKTADQFGALPLHEACKSGNPEVVKLLIEHGADVKAIDRNGRTTLIEACTSGNIEMVKFIMSCDVDVNAADRNGWTPLNTACRSGNLEIVRFLIENGADMKSVDHYGRTALHRAVGSGSIETLEALLENGANINAVDQNGRTPLAYALSEKQWKVATFLLEHGAAIDVEAYYDQNYRDRDNIGYRGLKGDSVDIDGKPVSRQAFLSFSTDYLTLFTDQVLGDHQLTSSDQQVILIHKKMFEVRLGRELSDADTAFFSTMKADRIQPFIQWMYSGIVSPQDEPSVREICRHFGIGDREFYLKNGPAGLRSDMERLYRNEQSKDFAILSGNHRIMADRMVLMARTTLFKEMFLTVKDDSNQVGNYSGMSYKALNIFIRYLYTNTIDDPKITMEIITELKSYYEFFLADRNESDRNNPFSFISKLTEVEERLKSRLQIKDRD